MPRLGPQRDAGGPGFERAQAALTHARALGKNHDGAAPAQVVVAAAEGGLVAGGPLRVRLGAGLAGILRPVDGDGVARLQNGPRNGVLEKRALGQKGNGLPPVHGREQRVHQGVGVVAGQQQRAGQAQPLGVAHLDAAEKDAQRHLHQRLHHGVKQHGREGKRRARDM